MECTVNRVGDTYHDQLERSGHQRRLDDLDRFAALGVRAMRYPVLWETTAPHGVHGADWSWPDARLARLRSLEIQPIVGLVHHGSGPRDTSLVAADFAPRLAEYAEAVARRFPWVDAYTPVNEPLTTARFSGMYGHWYPHGRNAQTWARALLNQCQATVLAMRAIRRVNPDARLVQTEDLGKTWSTPPLAYQAEFENERRWLSFDLLCGRVGPDHPMWHHLCWLGIEQIALEWFRDNPCPPDILGINHYVTGERFLDERLERYPPSTHGGNGRHRYADVEAVRVAADGPAGPEALLREVWDRYRLPLAVTEVHLGCTREEQLRWLHEVWQAATSLRRGGADVRAVTAWSLLGAYDWNSLLTRRENRYEPGVFDLRTPDQQPRPTALAGLLRDLASGRKPDHPVLATPGWWHRPQRLAYPPAPAHQPAARGVGWEAGAQTARPLLITGGRGLLAQALARLCDERGLPHRLLGRDELDITNAAAVEKAVAALGPWAVVNAAGYGRVDDAEREPRACFRDNLRGAALLAAVCARSDARLLTFSSAMVFDGRKAEPYVESDPVAPLSVYGRSKAQAEAQVRKLLPSALVVRTSALFGPWDEENFVTAGLRALAAGLPFSEANDSLLTPAYLPDLVHASLDLLIDNESGVWHLANPASPVTRAGLVRRAARFAGLDASLVGDGPARAASPRAPRPARAVLGSERGVLLPALDDALARYVRDACVLWRDKGQDSPPVARALRGVGRRFRRFAGEF